MALVPDQKFGTFQVGGTLITGDIIVGLRDGINTQFDWVLPEGVDAITGTANQILVNGSSGSPVTGDVTLTTPQDIAPTSSPTFNALTLTNPLTVANGGSGRSSLTAYTLLAGGTSATGNLQQVSAGSSGQILQSNGASALPSWVSLSSVGVTSITGTANQVLANGISGSAEVGAIILTLPQDIATNSTPTFLAANIGNLNIATNTISSTNGNGNVNLYANGTGSILISNNTPLTLDGSLPTMQVTEPTGQSGILISGFTNAVGGSGYLALLHSRNPAPGSFSTVINGDNLGALFFCGDDGAAYQISSEITSNVDGAVSAGIIPSNIRFLTSSALGVLTTAMTISSSQITTLANPLPVGSGGLGITTTPSNGQIPIGNGTNYVAATLTAGTGISITNASGAITLNAAGGGLTWNSVAGTSQALAVNNGYIFNNAAATTGTLPATATVGEIVEIEGNSSTAWILTANTGQTIINGNEVTTSGGTLTSNLGSDIVNVICIVANTTWKVRYCYSSGLTAA